ncbi:MAG: hypothetical protein LBM96_08885 [Methanobrevibacter sp.]|jgi:hypothetical protein|nr:hypothetical protein [Candidatus Methanoflexus mossambicus]
MKKIKTSIYSRYGKDIYINNSSRGWAIVIMPEEIRIDNYHKEPHIHIKSNRPHLPIKFSKIDEVGLIVELHLEKYNGININELKNELIGEEINDKNKIN